MDNDLQSTNYNLLKSDISVNKFVTSFEFLQEDTEISEERMYDLYEFGYFRNQEWYEVFKSNPEENLYIREMLSYGEKLSKNARVKLSTIHAAKGGESDNVLLVLDNARKIRESVLKNVRKRDEEHRVWYVGVTRAKQNLYFIAGKNKEKSYDIESLG